MSWKTSTIDHEARIRMGLSMNDYVLLDHIYKTQTSPKYGGKNGGWCDIAFDVISKFFGISKGGISGIMKKLADDGFLEIVGKKRRATEKWYSHYEGDVQKMNTCSESEQVCSESEQDTILYNNKSKNTPLPPEGEKNEPKAKSSKKAGAACAAATESDFSKFANPEAAMLIWRKWVDYKKIQKGFTYKDDAAQAAGISKLFNCSGGSIQKARAVIDDAMANGYTGFFPYKDEMAASAQVSETPPVPVDDFPLTDDMQKRYDSTTSWFYKNCPSCTGVRWLSKKEFMSVMNRSEDLIPPMWYTKCPEDDFNSHVTKSISSLNAAPRWEKEKWPSIFEWLRHDLKIRIFGKKDNQ